LREKIFIKSGIGESPRYPKIRGAGPSGAAVTLITRRPVQPGECLEADLGDFFVFARRPAADADATDRDAILILDRDAALNTQKIGIAEIADAPAPIGNRLAEAAAFRADTRRGVSLLLGDALRQQGATIHPDEQHEVAVIVGNGEAERAVRCLHCFGNHQLDGLLRFGQSENRLLISHGSVLCECAWCCASTIGG
jgi:hypothetical protein